MCPETAGRSRRESRLRPGQKRILPRQVTPQVRQSPPRPLPGVSTFAYHSCLPDSMSAYWRVNRISTEYSYTNHQTLRHTQIAQLDDFQFQAGVGRAVGGE